MALNMPIRAKTKRSTPRRSTAISARVERASRGTRADRAVGRVTRTAGDRKAESKREPIHHNHHDHKASSNGHGGANGAGGINSYSKALRFVASLNDYERLRIVRYNPQNFDLERMRTLLKKLGNPQERFRSVHVAGTKGKGSTCAMIASMVQAAGYKTGLYTSPHLVDIRERFQIDSEMISQAEFCRLVRQIEPIVARMKPTPTCFDVLTAMAFKYFADQGVELAVIETGLG